MLISYVKLLYSINYNIYIWCYTREFSFIKSIFWGEGFLYKLLVLWSRTCALRWNQVLIGVSYLPLIFYEYLHTPIGVLCSVLRSHVISSVLLGIRYSTGVSEHIFSVSLSYYISPDKEGNLMHCVSLFHCIIIWRCVNEFVH